MDEVGGGGLSQFSVGIFLSHSAENFRGGTLQCFRKFRVSKSFMHKKGISLFSVETFLSHSAEKFRGEPFNFSENFGYWGYHYSLLKIFCLTAEKIREGEPFCVSKNSGIENFHS